jgi:PilZ domain
MTSFDKRKARRLRLRRPAPATFASMPVWILDVSETGARVEHSNLLKWGQNAQLEFWWKKDKIRVSCEVVRTDPKPDSSDPERMRTSGLRFCNPRDPSLQHLRQLVGQALTLVLEQSEQSPQA